MNKEEYQEKIANIVCGKSEKITCEECYILADGNVCKNFKECRIAEKTEEQLEYVMTSIKENVFLKACAGSGKTEVIGLKAAYEMKKWNSYNQGIAVLTFTNDATDVIIDRVKQFTGRNAVYPHYIGTFTSWLHGYIANPFLYKIAHNGCDGKEDTSLRIVDSDCGSEFLNAFKTKYSYGQQLHNIPGNAYHWNIKTAGVYRIVININTKKVTIYSPETDPKSMVVSWTWNNNTVTTTIERVFIWGPYDGWAKDGTGDTGFTMAHSMTPSLANPYLFIYKGAELPRKNSIKDKDGNAHPGGLNFKVGPQSAGCYTFGSTADAIRGSYDGCLDIAESDYNQKQTVVGGQSHNRYAFFSVPVGVNYIELDIKELTVFFDKR